MRVFCFGTLSSYDPHFLNVGTGVDLTICELAHLVADAVSLPENLMGFI